VLTSNTLEVISWENKDWDYLEGEMGRKIRLKISGEHRIYSNKLRK
jgi:hypothetical protein